jgi:hypothetical protein
MGDLDAIVLLGSMRGMSVIVLYPEALNQHPADAIDTFRGFLFGIPIGAVAYMLALLMLLVGTLIKRRRTTLDRQTLHTVFRAAIPIGAAFTLYGPIMGISEITQKLVVETLAFSTFAVTVIAAALVAAVMMRRSRLLNVSRLFPDSWWVLIVTVPLLIGIAASVFSARQNAEVASREVKTEGVIIDCQPFNLCRFTFTFLGRSFEGAGTPATDKGAGHSVTIFFDGSHPETNSLEDFTSPSRRQIAMVPLCLMAICAIVGAVLYAPRKHSRAANHVLSA